MAALTLKSDILSYFGFLNEHTEVWNIHLKATVMFSVFNMIFTDELKEVDATEEIFASL